MKIVKEIYADTVQKNAVKTITAKQYDKNSRFLCVHMTNSGKIIGADADDTAVINAKRSDSESKTFRGTINSDGSITVPLTSWMSELCGEVECDVGIIDSDGRKLTSMIFPIFVERAVRSSEEITEDEGCDIFAELVAEAKKAEEERGQAEALRASSETDRVTNEKERVESESARIAAEDDRAEAEEKRLSEEQNRCNAETARADAEIARIAAEWDRISAENARTEAETLRQTAEEERVNAETERTAAEWDRVAAEDERAVKEKIRAEREIERETAEGERNSAESARKEMETMRKSVETARVNAETLRKTAETARVNAETARQTAETARASAEAARQAAEEERAEAFEDMFDRACPRGSVSAAGASAVLTDCCGGTNIRNYAVHGAEGGIGDLNADTGKYDIPVTVHGKNLLARNDEFQSSGVTIKTGTDKWVMDGTQSGGNAILKVSSTQATVLKPGTYTISLSYISGSYADSTGNATWIGLKTMNNEWVTNFAVRNSNFTTDKQSTFTITAETKCSWAMSAVGIFSGYTFSMQLEKGSAATAFEPYTAPKTYTISLDAPLGQGESVTRETGGDIALTDGTTNIIEIGTAVAPSKIEVEYYKDINKVLENLNNAILSQGGNV